MNFKVGDIVKVREYIQLNEDHETPDGLWIADSMIDNFSGKTYKIYNINNDSEYVLEELPYNHYVYNNTNISGWLWDDYCLLKAGINFM